MDETGQRQGRRLKQGGWGEGVGEGEGAGTAGARRVGAGHLAGDEVFAQIGHLDGVGLCG